MIGAKTGFFTGGDFGDLKGGFQALPSQIYQFAKLPENKWGVTAAAILVLLVIVLLINTVAILLRNRFEKKKVNDDVPPDETAPTVDLTREEALTHTAPRWWSTQPTSDKPVVFEVTDLGVYYADFKAVRDVNLTIHRHEVTKCSSARRAAARARSCAASTA